MNTVVSQDFEDWPDWPLRDTRYMSYGSTATEDSEASLLSISRFQPPPSPTTSISPTVSDKGRPAPPVDVVRVNLSPSVTVYVFLIRRRLILHDSVLHKKRKSHVNRSCGASLQILCPKDSFVSPAIFLYRHRQRTQRNIKTPRPWRVERIT